MSTISPPKKMGAPASNGGPLLEQARSRRRRRAIPTLLAGLLLAVIAFVGFLAAQPKPQGRPVLELANPVVAGHSISRGDLKTVTVHAPGVPTIAASAVGKIVGQAPTVSLPAGALVLRAELAPAAGPRDGQAIAAVNLKPGAFSPDLQAGAKVQVFAGGQPVTEATVYSRHRAADGTGTVLSLLLPARSAAPVGQAAQAGKVRLVWVAG
jgi:hypothetical protein